jgi:chromosome segregation ATPase
MIEQMNASLVRWSAEHKKWTEKWSRSAQKKDAFFQPYTTTLDLFLTVVSLLNQIGVRFDESSRQLSNILQKVPDHQDPVIKSKLERQTKLLKDTKRALDDLEKKRTNINDDLKRTQKKMRNCRSNTQKQTKLQEHCNSLKQKRKQLKTDIIEQTKTYRQVQKQYRTNTENIYQQSQQKELARLTNMSEPLRNFIEALKIDPALLTEAIQKHDPKADLTSWKEKYFTSTFQETSV